MGFMVKTPNLVQMLSGTRPGDQGSNSGYGPQVNFVVFHNGRHFSKWLPRFLSMGT